MKTDRLASAIHDIVLESVNDETIGGLAADSKWYRRLSRSDRLHVNEIVTQAVEEAVTGALRILEDVKDVDRDEHADLDLSFVVSDPPSV